MGNKEFVVPGHETILDKLGVEPVLLNDDELIYEINFVVGDYELHFSYSLIGRSVRYLLYGSGRPIVDIFREEATLFTVGDHPRMNIYIEYQSEGMSGELTIFLSPVIEIKDSSLIS